MVMYYNNWMLHCSYFMITRIQSSMLACILLDTFKFPNLNSFNMLYPQCRTLVLPCNGAQTWQSMLMSPKSKIQCMQGTTRITTLKLLTILIMSTSVSSLTLQHTLHSHWGQSPGPMTQKKKKRTMNQIKRQEILLYHSLTCKVVDYFHIAHILANNQCSCVLKLLQSHSWELLPTDLINFSLFILSYLIISDFEPWGDSLQELTYLMPFTISQTHVCLMANLVLLNLTLFLTVHFWAVHGYAATHVHSSCLCFLFHSATAMWLHHVFNLCYACPRQYW